MHIRPAQRSDSADLAILDDIASRGLASWLWSGAVERGENASAHECGRQKMADDHMFSWRSATVAVVDDMVAGMVLGYRLPETFEDGPASDPVLEPIVALLRRVPGTVYVDSLAVYSHHRGQGIGRELLRSHMRGNGGVRPVTLITEDDNQTALHLYASEGFAEAARADCIPFSKEQTTREWVLLVRESSD